MVGVMGTPAEVSLQTDMAGTSKRPNSYWRFATSRSTLLRSFSGNAFEIHFIKGQTREKKGNYHHG